MGTLNPRTGKYEAIRRVITADGKGATKAEDALAFELESGDIVGGEEYEDFVSNVKKIDADVHARTRELREAAQAKKAALAKALLEKKRGE